MTYTFNNVSVSIEASSPKEAYEKLCNLFWNERIEYTTDTYVCEEDDDLEERSTEELFLSD